MPAREGRSEKVEIRTQNFFLLPFPMNVNQIQARGTITEVLNDGACRVELANGHRCIARTEKNTASAPPSLGDSVLIAFHPYDLSRGRIIG